MDVRFHSTTGRAGWQRLLAGLAQKPAGWRIKTMWMRPDSS
jgi:hypothetical protein